MSSRTLPETETPFRIEVSDDKIELLKKKLALTTFPDELEDAGRDYGVPLADIQRLVSHWKDGYDWRKYEKELNEELPQFKRDIDVDGFGTLGIHYVHKKSEIVGAIPLLFVHGWPGSFLEVRKILPLLTQTAKDHPSFHVVTFSLPGYGFSDAPKKKGFAISQYAEVGNKLMISLGYNEYVTQGGDWGYAITQRIAKLYGGKHSKAWHSNFEVAAPGQAPPRLFTSPWLYLNNLITPLKPADKAALERTAWFAKQGRGYSEEQSTQPQTLGYSLADSPVGLLAWIYEKLVNWSDDYPWNDDEVLTWISIYWFSSAGPTASVRIYYERKNTDAASNSATDSTRKAPIPRGVSRFPKELMIFPRLWTRTPDLVFEADHESGGHFAAYEKPVELVGDLRKMFGKGGPAFGVVKGNDGYQANAKL
ncbi:Alpha/Beta hydrolase protein [Crassisporium funariophilum]|nr:Alpha/Beta hydrolase protein [Crassisporium funariophilum]